MKAKELEKLLGHEEIKLYSRTYFLMADELIEKGSNKRFTHYTKVNWLRQRDSHPHYLAQLLHEWTVEFQVKHVHVKWNGDYVQAVWDFLDEKLDEIKK